VAQAQKTRAGGAETAGAGRRQKTQEPAGANPESREKVNAGVSENEVQ